MKLRTLIYILLAIILAIACAWLSLFVKTSKAEYHDPNVIACCSTWYDNTAGWPIAFATSADLHDGVTGAVDKGPQTIHYDKAAADFMIYLVFIGLLAAIVPRVIKK